MGTLERSWQANEKGINGITFSPDGKWLASMADGDQARLWEVATQKEVHPFGNVAGKTSAVAFAPDGESMVVGGDRGEVSVVDITNKDQWSLRARFAWPPAPIRLLALSPDGTLVATSGEDFVVRLWNLADGRPVAALEGHKRDVTAIDFSHDGSLLASASRDGTVKLWDVAERREYREFDRHHGYVHHVAFTPDDHWVLATTRDGDAPFWEVASGSKGRVLRSGSAPVYAGAISPDGRQVATASRDGLIHLWNGAPDPERASLVPDVPGRAMTLSPDSRVVAVGDREGNLRFYNAVSGEFMKEFLTGQGSIDWIAFSRQGDQLAICLNDQSQTVQLRSYPEFTLLHVLIGHHGRLRTAQFSPSGESLSICSDSKTVRMWDTGRGVVRLEMHLNVAVRDTAFSPDGRLLAGACRDGVVRIWRVSDGAEMEALVGHSDEVLCVVWSPDGKLLASGEKENMICLWDATRFALADRIMPLQGLIDSVAFSPDGKALASGGNRTIKLWDVESREQTLLLEGHGASVCRLAFSAAGDSLYSFAEGNPCEVYVWPTRQGVRVDTQ